MWEEKHGNGQQWMRNGYWQQTMILKECKWECGRRKIYVNRIYKYEDRKIAKYGKANNLSDEEMTYEIWKTLKINE